MSAAVREVEESVEEEPERLSRVLSYVPIVAPSCARSAAPTYHSVTQDEGGATPSGTDVTSSNGPAPSPVVLSPATKACFACGLVAAMVSALIFLYGHCGASHCTPIPASDGLGPL